MEALSHAGSAVAQNQQIQQQNDFQGLTAAFLYLLLNMLRYFEL